MMPTWQARPTVYKGIRMRSRLEARMAAELDSYGNPWRYEPCAYASERGQYLPDFVVDMPTKSFIEVRATQERAAEAMPQMEIILESEPAAWLLAVVPGTGAYVNEASDREWYWVDFP